MPLICTCADNPDAPPCGEEVLTFEQDPTIPPDYVSCPEHGLIPEAICTRQEAKP